MDGRSRKKRAQGMKALWKHKKEKKKKMKIDGYFLITYSISLLQSVPWQNQEPKREMENKK